MGVAAASLTPDLQRQVTRLQILTIAWMSVEAFVALAAAWKAQSPALLGFGGDSAVELFSAVVVLWRFHSSPNSGGTEKLAARVAGALLFVLAIFVMGSAGLSLLGYHEPHRTLVGIVVLVVAAFGMPWLANRKRTLADLSGSASLRADATESAICGYMSWIALGGLLTNAVFHKSWADPIAALVLIPLIVKEGWEAMSASRPGCQC